MSDVVLRNTLTPFGQQLAVALEPPQAESPLRIRIIAPAEAVEPMRQILASKNLEDVMAMQQGDGTKRPTWYEAPALFIQRWTGSESAVVLKEDAEGRPYELRFLTRLATDKIETVMRIGDGPFDFGLRQALWDVGIRQLIGEISVERTPAAFIQRLHSRGLVLRDRGDGWLEYADVMASRPDPLTPRPWLDREREKETGR